MEKEKKEKVIRFVHKWLLHLEALCIIALLLFGYMFLFQDRELKQEISQNCGWEGEDYQCYCEKNEALAIKNKLQTPGTIDFPVNITYVEVVE